MKQVINKEEIFRSQQDSFAVAATSSGFTLSYSVDKTTWTDYATAVPAGENLMVVGVPLYVYFKLKGNVDDNVVVML